MDILHRSAHSRMAALVSAAVLLLVGACIHDWEEWLPEATGTPTATNTGTPTATNTGTGGTGTGTFPVGGQGGEAPGTCPGSGLSSAALIKVAVPQGVSMCIDETEVTKGQYKAWLDTSPAPGDQTEPCLWNVNFLPQDPDWEPPVEEESLPVFGVDWCDARAYCEGVGKRLCGRIVPPGDALPTGQFDVYFESEWYNACTERGAHTFPYGGNYEETTCNGDGLNNGGPVDVGSLSGCSTTAGVLDLSGNVYEWENSCSGSSSASDTCRVRGGAYNAGQALLQCPGDLLQARDLKHPTVGIRCCADPEY